MSIIRSGIEQLVRPVAAEADGFAGPDEARFPVTGDFEIALEQIEMFDRTWWVRIGFKRPAWPRLEIIPLQLLNQIERAGDRQPAQPILALEDRHAGLGLEFDEIGLGVMLQHLIDRRIEGA